MPHETANTAPPAADETVIRNHNARSPSASKSANIATSVIVPIPTDTQPNVFSSGVAFGSGSLMPSFYPRVSTIGTGVQSQIAMHNSATMTDAQAIDLCTAPRLDRLTNSFSKKWENHELMLALFVAWYNFCQPYRTLKTTPAIAAGLASETWSIERLFNESAKA
jgi:hypothetical protein